MLPRSIASKYSGGSFTIRLWRRPRLGLFRLFVLRAMFSQGVPRIPDRLNSAVADCCYLSIIQSKSVEYFNFPLDACFFFRGNAEYPSISRTESVSVPT